MGRADIAALVPVFNPGPGLKTQCEALLRAFETVVVVDDGSHENGGLFDDLPEGVHVLHHTINRGKGRAIKTGLAWVRDRASQVKAAVVVNGDGRHRVEDAVRVAERAVETDRIVLGVRDLAHADLPLRRRLGTRFASLFVRVFHRIPVSDAQSGLRAVPRRLFELMLAIPGERFDFEMRLYGRLAECHEKLEQLPIASDTCDNPVSRSRPVSDSLQACRGLFSGTFSRFALSSMGCYVIDVLACMPLMWAFQKFGLVKHFGIFLAVIPARLLSAFVNYHCNRVLVFGSTVPPRVSLRRYAALALMVLTLSYLGMITVYTSFEKATVLSMVTVMALKTFFDGLLFVLSYRMQQVWVFQSTEETEFDARAVGRRVLSFCGPVFPFAVLLFIDIFVGCLGQGWPLNIETFGSSLKFTVLTLMPVLVLPLIFRRQARWVMPVLYCWMIIVVALEVTAWNVFHVTVRGELLAIIMGTSLNEIGGFCREFLTLRTLLTAIALGVALYFGCRMLWRHPGAYPKRPIKSYVLAILIVVLAVKLGYKVEHANSTYLVVDSIDQFDRYRKIAEAVRQPDVSDVIAPEKRVPIVIVVVGESATRDHWNLYGYPKETTPCLSARKDELIVFDDLLAPWSHTQEVIQLLLTRGTLQNRDAVVATMPQILAKAGYRSLLLSNQPRWGVFDSIATLMFVGCEREYHLPDSRQTTTFDGELLLDIEREIAAMTDDRPTVMFTHLYGSHCPWHLQYPPEAAFFPAKDEHDGIPHYDNTIRYTDSLLGKMLDKLEKLDREIVFVYLSDHGDSPDSGEARVANDPSLWRVPFFIWCSNRYRQAYPERVAALERARSMPLQSDRLFDGLLELMNVRLKGREKESFLHPDYESVLPHDEEGRIQRFINDGREGVGPKWDGQEKGAQRK